MVLVTRHYFSVYWTFEERIVYYCMPPGSKHTNKHAGKPFPLNMTGCSWRLYRLYGNLRSTLITKIERKKRNVKDVLPTAPLLKSESARDQ